MMNQRVRRFEPGALLSPKLVTDTIIATTSEVPEPVVHLGASEVTNLLTDPIKTPTLPAGGAQLGPWSVNATESELHIKVETNAIARESGGAQLREVRLKGEGYELICLIAVHRQDQTPPTPSGAEEPGMDMTDTAAETSTTDTVQQMEDIA